MNPNDPAKRDSTLLTSSIALGTLVLALYGAFLFGGARASRGFATTLEASLKKSRLVTNMEVQLLASVGAEKGAVMAETDVQSQAFAAESMRASAIVENDRSELGRLIEIGARPDELQPFRELSACWTRYQEVDREILGLAVENSNLKAQKLSFIPAHDALARMRAALDTLVGGAGVSSEAVAIAKGAYQALTAAQQIHSLENRHIAAPGDEEMDGIEAEMKTLDERVDEGLRSLSALGLAGGAVAVEAARAAYSDFQKVNAEVLVLSRRNTNVHSLAISLGQKRKVMAECLDRLHALQEAVRMDDARATR